ncbi:MAG TPA: hypothetical protein PLK19_15740 [Mycobacterium sp.]|nr:hypothetical protein [Mycobacterium sp.]
MKIKVENAYSDGYQSTVFHDVDDATLPADEEALWEELWTYTGDGHGQNLDAIYEVTIIEAAVPTLVGLSREFG